MATFVLVHGGWSGAHGWRTVRQFLAGAGHDVYTPSLTGIGERVHLVSPQVDLTTHVHDVVNHVIFEDLCHFVLVGYSYGGAVVTASVEHLADRIRDLVYLDAFVPGNGQSVAALSGRGSSPSIFGAADWLVPPPDRHYDDPQEAAWQTARRVPHPMKCFTDPVQVTRPIEEYSFGLTYIKATADSRSAPGGNAFWDAAEHAAESARWQHHGIATNHMVASNRPRELADLLAAIGTQGEAAAVGLASP